DLDHPARGYRDLNYFSWPTCAHYDSSALVWGASCRRESRQLKVSLGDPAQPLQCNSKLTPTLVFGKFVYLVDYHETDVSQVPSKYSPRKNRLKSLWSRDEQVGWASGLAGSLLDLGITMPDPDLEVDLLPPPSQPVEQVSVECSKGSDVDDLDSRSAISLVQEPREHRENGRLSFPTCRRRD